jgi:hypothetical protein
VLPVLAASKHAAQEAGRGGCVHRLQPCHSAGGRVRVGCWAHVRRRFFEALSTAPEAQQALDFILSLYRVEAHAGQAGMARTAAHRALRQQKSSPVLMQLHEWLQVQRTCTRPRAPWGRLSATHSTSGRLWATSPRKSACLWVESSTGAVVVGRGESLLPAAFAYLAGASFRVVAPFPVPAPRTGRAALPHPALT